MTREEAIKILKAIRVYECYPKSASEETKEAIDMAIEALSAEPKMKVCEERQNGECPFYTPDWLDDDVSEPSDLISRADAIACLSHGEGCGHSCRNRIKALPSADAVQGWRTDKPTKQGEYTVTVKSMRGGMVELLYYGKPLMPNYKVKGMCWYRSDDEWGDVVYDDSDILAWMPLPKPYREKSEVEECRQKTEK